MEDCLSLSNERGCLTANCKKIIIQKREKSKDMDNKLNRDLRELGFVK